MTMCVAVSCLRGGTTLAQDLRWHIADSNGPQGGGGLVYEAARNQLFHVPRTITSRAPTTSYAWSPPSGWRSVPTTGLVGRRDFAFAYDSQRAVTVLFGGIGSGSGFSTTVYGDTWEWNGTAWALSQAQITGEDRSLMSMVYDSARHVMVMYGGVDYNAHVLAETWEYNGTAWSQRPVTGPGPRYGYSMAFDSARGVTVLHGGSSGLAPTNDTWEWDGAAWAQRAASGPATFNGSMTYDPDRQQSVLLPNTGDDTWAWDGAQWRIIVHAALNQNSDARMTYDALRHRVVLFAGGSPYNILYVLSPCGTANFNGDGDTGTDSDIEAFFRCLAGNCCLLCESIDFNGDGDVGTDADIEAFFRVLAGNNC